MTANLPTIGIVIIGINVEKYLSGCIQSIKECDYPDDLLEIVYVDGGSTDNSSQIARTFEGLKVIELYDPHPTPGRGRNIGWKSLSTPVIQFLDADTKMHPLWLKRALPQLSGDVAAVCGHRRELKPQKNLFHLFTDIEWGYGVGLCKYFGGDVLITREVLVKTRGYDNDLIAGEDPELSYRIRQMGLNILRIDTPMTTHDINMSTVKAYLKRAYRSGYGYAEICLRFIMNKEKIWLRKITGITGRLLLPYFFIILGFVTGYVWPGIILGLFSFFRPLCSLNKIRRNNNLTLKHSILYAIHYIVVDYPQFCGIIRYLLGQIANIPLRNQGYREISG